MKKKKPDAVVVIPAFNESEYVGNVLKTCIEAKQAGIIKEVMVINDGSTDKTAEISKAYGAKVVSLKPNRGKGPAFLFGYRECRRLKAKTMVMLDADLLNLHVSHIRGLLEKVSGTGTKMAVMAVLEKGQQEATTDFSGQRAIKMDALNFLSVKGKNSPFSKPAQRFLGLAYGFGLETALNNMMKSRMVFFYPKKFLRARAAMPSGSPKQLIQLKTANFAIEVRKRQLEFARKQRAERAVRKI